METFEPILKKVTAFIVREGSGPTVREFMKMAGSNSVGSAHKMLLEMEEMGLIERDAKKARSLRMRPQ